MRPTQDSVDYNSFHPGGLLTCGSMFSFLMDSFLVILTKMHLQSRGNSRTWGVLLYSTGCKWPHWFRFVWCTSLPLFASTNLEISCFQTLSLISGPSNLGHLLYFCNKSFVCPFILMHVFGWVNFAFGSLNFRTNHVLGSCDGFASVLFLITYVAGLIALRCDCRTPSAACSWGWPNK